MVKEFFKDTKPFGQLVALCVLVVLFFVVASGITACAVLFGMDVGNTTHMLLLQVLTQAAVFLLPAVVFVMLFSACPGQTLQLRFSRRMWWLSLVGVAVLLLSVPFSDWLTQVNDSWHWSGRWAALEESLREQSSSSQDFVDRVLSQKGVATLLLNLFVMAVVPAVCEEFFFRGALQTVMMRWLRNPHVAIGVTAALFSLMHGEFFAFLPRFFLGVLLGYLFYYSGSMLVNMCAHFFNNAVVVIVYYLYAEGAISGNVVENINAPWYAVAAGMVLAVAVFYAFFVRPKMKNISAVSCDGEEVSAVHD